MANIFTQNGVKNMLKTSLCVDVLKLNAAASGCAGSCHWLTVKDLILNPSWEWFKNGILQVRFKTAVHTSAVSYSQEHNQLINK